MFTIGFGINGKPLPAVLGFRDFGEVKRQHKTGSSALFVEYLSPQGSRTVDADVCYEIGLPPEGGLADQLEPDSTNMVLVQPSTNGFRGQRLSCRPQFVGDDGNPLDIELLLLVELEVDLHALAAGFILSVVRILHPGHRAIEVETRTPSAEGIRTRQWQETKTIDVNCGPSKT